MPNHTSNDAAARFRERAAECVKLAAAAASIDTSVEALYRSLAEQCVKLAEYEEELSEERPE